MLKSLAFAALLSLPIAVFAQDQAGKTVTKENAVTATATIRRDRPSHAIDHPSHREGRRGHLHRRS